MILRLSWGRRLAIYRVRSGIQFLADKIIKDFAKVFLTAYSEGSVVISGTEGSARPSFKVWPKLPEKNIGVFSW